MGQNIKLTASDGFELDAYRADPAGTPKGGIVVVQEIFGVNPHIRDVCDRFAALGYAAIAPAFFDRVEAGVSLDYVEPDITTGRELAGKLDWNNTMKDAQAAIDALRSAGKVGVVGYCWGGTVAFRSTTVLDADCAVGYYGRLINDFLGETPKAPVMLHYGAEDASIPLENVDAVKAAFPQIPVNVFPGQHGFSCDARGSYHPDSAAKALELTLGFFAEHLS